MNRDDIKERSKKIEEKIIKEIVPLAESLSKEFSLNDSVIYGKIGDVAHDSEYKKRVFIGSGTLKALKQQKHDLEATRGLIWDEVCVIEEQIKMHKRLELQNSKLFENFEWEINTRGAQHLDIESSDKEFHKKTQVALDEIFGSWGGLKCIYKFDDGRTIDCYYNRDDGYLSINMYLDSITPEEYLLAFNLLGIKISFNDLQKVVDEKTEQIKNYKVLMKKFK